jgi:hypothetical protein
MTSVTTKPVVPPMNAAGPPGRPATPQPRADLGAQSSISSSVAGQAPPGRPYVDGSPIPGGSQSSSGYPTPPGTPTGRPQGLVDAQLMTIVVARAMAFAMTGTLPPLGAAGAQAQSGIDTLAPEVQLPGGMTTSAKQGDSLRSQPIGPSGLASQAGSGSASTVSAGQAGPGGMRPEPRLQQPLGSQAPTPQVTTVGAPATGVQIAG